jgi:hypothetical protein
MRRGTLLALAAAALAAGAAVLPAGPARADVADVWTTYPSISACQSDLLNLNDFCYGLQDGQALGLIDAGLTVDELDQSLGIPYDDENVLPAPERPANPVVQVWNNTATYTFLAAGTSLAADASTTTTIYFIPPYSDDAGPAIDADGAMARFIITTADGATIPVSGVSGLDQSVQTVPY